MLTYLYTGRSSKDEAQDRDDLSRPPDVRQFGAGPSHICFDKSKDGVKITVAQYFKEGQGTKFHFLK